MNEENEKNGFTYVNPQAMKHCLRKNAFKTFECFLILAGFLCCISLPVLTMNHINGKVSETEKRQLANFPAVFDEAGKINSSLKQEVEQWLSDNIGFRSYFVKIAANMKLKIFQQSTSEKVAIGNEGWYFYTLDHNIEQATGRYKLNPDMLRDIAEKQQYISDYYKKSGITYLLILTPSKASIYPEFLMTNFNKVQETICDQLEKYLEQHTTVNVLNIKPYLLEHKSDGKLYLKTDTHWTQLGSYVAFNAIDEKLNELGVKKSQSLDVNFTEGNTKGEFSLMLGADGILGEECVPIAQWQSHVMQVEKGELWNNLTELNQNDSDGRRYPVVLYENASALNKTLLIYGDSQWMTTRNLPQWLGERFQKVVSMRIRSIRPQLDRLVDPNIVIFGCSERLVDTVLTRPLEIPCIVDQLPNLPQKPMISEAEYGQWLGNRGIWMDKCNGEKPASQGELRIDPSRQIVELVGWAADFCNEKPLSSLYITVGDIVMQCQYGIERQGFVDHFKKEEMLQVGFKIFIPTEILQKENAEEIMFFGVSADGEILYEPVAYQVNYE